MNTQQNKKALQYEKPVHSFAPAMRLLCLVLFLVASIALWIEGVSYTELHAAASTEDKLVLPYASLHQAVAARDLYAVLDYIEAGAALEILDVERLTPYLRAVQVGAPHIATALREAGASERSLAPGGNNAGHLAAAANRVYTLDTLCQQHVALSLQRNREQYLSIHVAAAQGHTEIARVLTHHGVRPDLPLNPEIYSAPLCLAAENKQWDTVAYLGAVGGDYGLEYAIYYEDFRTIRMILDRNPSLLEQGDLNDLRPLHSAVCLGREKAFELLLDYGADTAVRSNAGKDALDYALQFNQPAIARMLLVKGADPNAVCQLRTGYRRIHLAAREAPAAMVALLLENGASVDAEDATGHTALFLAVQGNRVEVVRVLLDAGAAVQPALLKLAREAGNAALLTLLELTPPGK